METIFRKVSVKDRLPDKRDYYFVIDTKGQYGTELCTEHGKFYKADDAFKDISYWLEEIKLPTDEEIEKESMQIADCGEESISYYNHGKMVGAKSMKRLVLAVAPLTSNTNSH